MSDKLLVEGMRCPACRMSVDYGFCIQELKECTESKPEADFGFMYGCMFSQALGLFYTLG